nr:TetR/AcrR family transcriptional regulator [Rhodococcus wratislaviensis]GLK33782.1 TetR family transcriptional regulator [Rhodococcus wratislaviensis]
MSTQLPTRKERADVVRNRAKIIEVAHDHFLAGGVSTSLEAVAKDAGVGPATLYRHFPNRDALLASVLEMRRVKLVGLNTHLSELDDTGEALRQWLLAVEDYFSLYIGLPEPHLSAIREQDPNNPLAQSCSDLISTTGEYVLAAQHDGHAQEGIHGQDLFLAASSLAWIRSTRAADDATIIRLRALLQDGYGRNSRVHEE